MNTSKPDGYALITGATGGLGKAFVRLLASEGYPLILTGRSEEKLKNLKQEVNLKYPNLDVKIYAMDLTKIEERQAFFNDLRGSKMAMLVNVAGVDTQKAVTTYSQEKIAMQCRVNLESAISMCKETVLNKAQHLDIINISSLSGLYPMPYFAIYSATKSALTCFSIAFREEVKHKGVHVTVVTPAGIPTREDIKRQIQGQGLWGKLTSKSADFIALKSLRAVRKNKRKLVPGFWNRLMCKATALLPLSWKLKFIANRWSKISKDAF